MAKKNSRDRRRQRREEAEERAAAREARGTAGQLVRLVEAGHAHCKEFRRLYTVGVKDNPSMAEGLPGPSRGPEEYDA